MSDGSSQRRDGGPSRGAAYQGSVEAVFAILIATGAGYWADQRFETAPRYLLIGAVIGFGAFVLRLMRMRHLFEPPAADAKTSEAVKAKEEDRST